MTEDVGKLHKMNPNQIQGHAAEERREGKATWRLDAWIHSSVPQCHCFFPGHVKQWFIWGIEMKKWELLVPKLEVFHGFQ